MRHPEIHMPRGESPILEDPFYSTEAADDFFTSLSRTAGGRRSGIRRPDHFSDPVAAHRLRARSPEARLIVVARNPVDRAHVAYYHYARFGFVEVGDPNEILRRLLDDEQAGKLLGRRREILEYGLYGRALEQWLKLFSLERFLFIDQTTLIKDTDATINTVWSFLDVTPVSVGPLEHAMEGVYDDRRIRLRQAIRPLMFSVGDRERLRPRSRIANAAFERIDRHLLARLWRTPRTPLSTETRSRLADFYRADSTRFEELSGLSLNR